MRHFLFLQGLPGPSMRLIARKLEQAGARTSRINFNGGDWMNWRFRGKAFRGEVADFGPFLRQYCRNQQVDAIVLFGETRPLHREAIKTARDMQIDIHVLEEGYLRPFSVALESWPQGQPWREPADLEDCASRSGSLPENFKEQPVPGYLRQRIADAMRYWAVSTIFSLFFGHYCSHRPYTPAAELFLWVRRYWRRAKEQRLSAAALAQMDDARFFLFPLQLDGDAALRVHSRFSTMAEAAEVVFGNFAVNAPAGTHLVVKLHPYDPDVQGWRALIDHMAHGFGIADRLHFVEFANLEHLLNDCAGVIAVNSTVGQLALLLGRPVMVLGAALYALPGLVHDGGMADFWHDPAPPQDDGYRQFSRALWAQCLVNGGFHSRQGLAMLAQGAADRILEHDN